MSAGSKFRGALPLVAVTLAIAFPMAASGQSQRLLEPDWNHQDVKEFTDRPRSASPEAGGAASPLDDLALPVLKFVKTPEAGERAMRSSPEVAAKHSETFDKANPVWYQITDDYGDVTISVEADRRIQNVFPEGHERSGSGDSERSASPQEDTDINVIDQKAEGIDGYITEYTVFRYGIPYTVTIECESASKESCLDKAKIAAEKEELKVVGGRPPQ